VSRLRRARVPAARHFRAGTLRADDPGSVLACLVLAPGPDWVAADLTSGALLRARAADVDADAHAGPEEIEAPLRIGRTLSAVEMTIGEDDELADPGRPEAVALAAAPVRLQDPRRRAVHRLLGHLLTRDAGRPLLGTIASSVSYTDLDGTRPSVVLVMPDERPRFADGPEGSWCDFTLGGRRHELAFLGRASSDAFEGSGIPRLLVVGFGSPQQGQLPKVVLGALPKV
jgi:hypothetical protein